MNPYRYIYITWLIGCVACSKAPDPVEQIPVQVGDLYAITLPDYLRPVYDMHDYASLQYYNTQEAFYVLGIEDAKENLGDVKRKRLKLKGYFAFVENTVLGPVDTFARESLEMIQLSDDLIVRVGDYYANSKLWNWDPLYYRICIFENETYFFQLVIWMPYDTHCDRINVVDAITQSFYFLPQETESTAGTR